MVAAWIGKGVVTPFWASLRTTPSGRPRSAKVTVGSVFFVRLGLDDLDDLDDVGGRYGLDDVVLADSRAESLFSFSGRTE